MLVEVGALFSWCIYSYTIVMLSVPYMWASMTFLPKKELMYLQTRESLTAVVSHCFSVLFHGNFWKTMAYTVSWQVPYNYGGVYQILSITQSRYNAGTLVVRR